MKLESRKLELMIQTGGSDSTSRSIASDIHRDNASAVRIVDFIQGLETIDVCVFNRRVALVSSELKCFANALLKEANFCKERRWYSAFLAITFVDSLVSGFSRSPV
jgi:hypothetical protein